LEALEAQACQTASVLQALRSKLHQVVREVGAVPISLHRLAEETSCVWHSDPNSPRMARESFHGRENGDGIGSMLEDVVRRDEIVPAIRKPGGEAFYRSVENGQAGFPGPCHAHFAR